MLEIRPVLEHALRDLTSAAERAKAAEVARAAERKWQSLSGRPATTGPTKAELDDGPVASGFERPDSVQTLVEGPLPGGVSRDRGAQGSITPTSAGTESVAADRGDVNGARDTALADAVGQPRADVLLSQSPAYGGPPEIARWTMHLPGVIARVGDASLIVQFLVALTSAVTARSPQVALSVLAEGAGALLAGIIALSWGLVARRGSRKPRVARRREDVAAIAALAGLVVSHAVAGASSGRAAALVFTFEGFSALLRAGASDPVHVLTTIATLAGIALWRWRDRLPGAR